MGYAVVPAQYVTQVSRFILSSHYFLMTFYESFIISFFVVSADPAVSVRDPRQQLWFCCEYRSSDSGQAATQWVRKREVVGG